MKLVSAAFGSRFVSRLAFISCFFWFVSTGNVREAPRVATRLERGGSWSLPAPGAQTRDRCIEGFIASELGMSVEGIRWKEEFASRVCAKIEVQESVARLRCVVQSGGTKVLWTQLKAFEGWRYSCHCARACRLIYLIIYKYILYYIYIYLLYIYIIYIYMQVSNNQHGYISTGYHQSSVPWFQTSFSIRGSKGA